MEATGLGGVKSVFHRNFSSMQDEKNDGSTNPKQAFGDKKPPLGQMPLTARIQASLALLDGSMKYGFRNWRERPVDALTYIHAAERHLALFAEGEELTRDTGVHNLGAVIACCSILIDAQVTGSLVDNRSKSRAACDELYASDKAVEHLKKLRSIP